MIVGQSTAQVKLETTVETLALRNVLGKIGAHLAMRKDQFQNRNPNVEIFRRNFAVVKSTAQIIPSGFQDVLLGPGTCLVQ